MQVTKQWTTSMLHTHFQYISHLSSRLSSTQLVLKGLMKTQHKHITCHRLDYKPLLLCSEDRTFAALLEDQVPPVPPEPPVAPVPSVVDGPPTSIVCCRPAPSRLGTVTFRTPEYMRIHLACAHNIDPASLLTKQNHPSALTIVIGSCDLAGVSAVRQADLQASLSEMENRI
jgi:hypothetical protein